MTIAVAYSSFEATYTSPQSTPAALSSAASSSRGLVFSGGFATYDSQPIALSEIIDDNTGRFTEAQQDQANETLQAREQAAYGQYEGTGTQEGNKAFVEAYIKYVQSLPPDEQNSQRYRGTLQAAQNLLNEINGIPTTSSNTDDTSKSTDPKAAALRILKGEETAQEKAKDTHDKHWKSSSVTPTDTINLSSTA